ncbi:MAG: DUF6070 family protein [Hespellia sp.]|nr:DUF6070 family protein [Hespellia sp.]
MKFKKFGYILRLMFILLLCFILNKRNYEKIETKNTNIFSENVSNGKKEEYEKGYDLPIEDIVRDEAIEDCKNVMRQIRDIYKNASKGDSINVVLTDETLLDMKKIIKDMGNPVTSTVHYATMENYKKMENFLENSQKGKTGNVILYEISTDGGITREKFIYDGADMYVLSARGTWGDSDKIVISYISFTRLNDWNYSERGWFCYEVCVPEPPEVTEIVDGSYLIRVRPLSEKCIEYSKKYVLPLGYRGNNLLCSNWNIEKMDELDYNGMFEYLYAMKYGDRFQSESYPNGIPVQEFESVIMEYLPVTEEQIREWAFYDEEHQTYDWTSLGCGNYAPTFFGASIPEVVDIKENTDGTVTLEVDAVCDMVVCSDAVITHKVRMKIEENGSFKYLGNEILDNGIEDIPAYQYRVKRI